MKNSDFPFIILSMANEGKTPLTPEEETLILVRKLWQAEKWRRFWGIFRYVVYIGVIFGAFYFLTPYIERYFSIIQGLRSAQSPQELQKVLQQLQK
ncbi:MAG TPA: hypothetical protein VJC01_04180 [Candidatus Paceibacterota bacterium]